MNSEQFRARALARVRLTAVSLNRDGSYGIAFHKDAGGDDDAGDSTVPDARTQKVDAFAALIVALFARLRRGTITSDEYVAAVEAAFDRAVGDVPDAVRAKIDALRQIAVERAQRYVDAARLDEEDPAAPSIAQKANWGNMVAGALWAATFAVAIAASLQKTFTWRSQGDDRVCDDCDELDGEEFTAEEIPFYPGEGDFGENTECGPECRCTLE